MNVQGVSRGDELGPTASASSGQKEEPVKKRKQSQVALVLEEYMDFRKKQTQKFVEEMKEPKEADKYSIANCKPSWKNQKADGGFRSGSGGWGRQQP